MAEDSFTDPVVDGLNLDGLALTDPEPSVVQPALDMSEEEVNLKAFSFVELTRERSVTEVKNKREQAVRDTLIMLGKDPNVDSFEQEITAIRQRKVSDDAVQRVNEAVFGPDEAVEIIEGSVAAGTVPVEDEVLIRASEQQLDDLRLLSDESNGDITFSYEEWVRETNQQRLELDLALSDISAAMDPSFISLYGDLLSEAVVPFGLSSSAAQFAKEVERQEGGSAWDQFLAGIEGFVLPGNAREKMRRFVMSIPPAERPAVARQLALAIRDKSGVTHQNDVQTLDWIETVISSADEDRHGFNWDRTLYNLITMVDAIPFVRKLPGAIARTGQSWFGTLARVNRMKARDILKENLADPNSTKGFTAAPEDLATGQLPKATLDDVNANPTIVADDGFKEQLPRAEGIIQGADNRAVNFTAKEVSSVVERLQSAYQSIKGGWLNVNKFVVDASQGDRVVVDSFFTRTKNEGGWLSPRSALNAAVKMTDGDLGGVRVLVREGDTYQPFLTGKELKRQFGTAKAGARDGNEYFIQIKREHFLTQVDQMAFGGNPVYFSAAGAGRYLGDATQQFSRDVWEPAYTALGRGQIFEKEAIDLARPFWGLRTGQRRRVTELIELGSQRKTTFTPRQLIDEYKTLYGKDITVGEMKGYYSFRNANDAVWATANRQVYREMQGQGYRTLTHPKSGDTWFTRPLRQGDAEVKRAYNPETRRIEAMSPTKLNKIREKGGGIEVLHKNDDIVRGSEATSYIIRNGTRQTNIDRLPINVLKYEEGYVSRIHKDTFFVARRDPIKRNGETLGPDGKQLTHDSVAVTARTRKEADELALRLQAETGAQHEVVDLAADSNYSKVVNDTMLLEQERLVFGKRTTDQLVRADGTPTPVVDPVEALHRAVNAVGRTIGIEDYVKGQEQRFIKTYSDIIDANKWQAYIRNRLGPSAIADDLAKGGTRRHEEAAQLWQYYQMLRGTESPISQRAFRSAVNHIAVGVEHILNSPTAGQYIARMADHDPASFAKGITFATLIAANPFRQYALQTMQFSFLVGANPRLAGASIKDFNLLRGGLNVIDTPGWKEWTTNMARVTGRTPAEIEMIVTQFKRSGLVAEIDSYAYVGAQIAQKNLAHTTNAVSGGFQILRNAINAPVRGAKKFGFVGGETNNLSMTYSFALREYLEKSGKNILSLSEKEWQQIGAQASSYALGMHKAGTMAYQQGLVSTLTQFWSIQHKAVAAMLPATLGGSRAFTASQKAGIAATQLGMYGAAGWGVESLIRDIFVDTAALDGVDAETSAEVTRIVSTGVMELVMNGILSSITGEDVDSSFSSSFAPAGAPINTVSDFVMTTLNLGIMDGLLQETAAGSTFGRYTDLAKYIYVTMAQGDTLPNTPDKLERVLLSIPTVLSGVSQSLKGFYAIRTGQLITQYGDHRVQMSWPEAFLKGAIGVSSNKEEDFRRLQELDGKGFYFKETDAREMAAMIYTAQVKNLLFFEGMGDFDMNRAMISVEGERALLSMLEAHEFDMVLREYNKLVNDRRGTEEDIFLVLLRFTDENAVSPEKIIRAVEQSMLFDRYPEQQSQMLYVLERMLEGQDERLEFYRESNKRFDDELNPLLDVED